jgi:hypothetical protein
MRGRRALPRTETEPLAGPSDPRIGKVRLLIEPARMIRQVAEPGARRCSWREHTGHSISRGASKDLVKLDEIPDRVGEDRDLDRASDRGWLRERDALTAEPRIVGVEIG